MENSIKENLISIRKKIAAAARRVGRDPEEIKLLAVSKRVTWQRIKAAAECGQVLFGENYVQEAQKKIPQLGQGLSWHFIGKLQSNKTRLAAELFTVIQTIDRLSLAASLNDHLGVLARSLAVFIQVNIGTEPQKAGVLPEKAAELLEAVAKLPHLKVAGLMAIPPFTAGPELARPYFRQLKAMADGFSAGKLLGCHGPVELSMGMSDDFEVAIEEGSTLVRVGTAIFGARD